MDLISNNWEYGVLKAGKNLGNFEHFSELLKEIILIDPFLKMK